tara:strand:- start:346 stop:2202 length:1857 start_codon:yes stop_codon:yes gene_type:complete
MNNDDDNSNKRITRSMTKNNNDTPTQPIQQTKKRKATKHKNLAVKKRKYKEDEIHDIFQHCLNKHMKKLSKNELEEITKYLISEHISNSDINELLNNNSNSINNIFNNIDNTNNKNKILINNIESNIENDDILDNINSSDDHINQNAQVIKKNDYYTDDEVENDSTDEDEIKTLRKSENSSHNIDVNNDTNEEDEQHTEFESDSDSAYDSDDNILYSKKNSVYFKTLDKIKKEKLLETEEQIKKLNNYDTPIKYQILESNLDIKNKAICMDKLESLQMLSEESGEFHKMKTWLETLLKVPFNTYTNLPVSMNNQPEDINKYLLKVYDNLNSAMYGQEQAKYQIIQYISQCISNPLSAGNVIGLCGPPGCGKTTLIKEGVSKAIERPFSFITLGGSGGANLFEGHSYTYEGATWGNIVSILIQSKCMNPIIYMDELDKISNTKEGKEISGILTHLTDPSQNKEFHDRYFSNIDFDLSKALIIFSYNDESKIDPILRDRLKVIYTKGYSEKEKLVIVKDYMLKSIYKNIGLNENDIILNEDNIKHIISKTTKEQGVRNLKRSLETIISKINVLRLNSHNLLNLPFKIKDFKLPITLTNEIIDNLIDKKVDFDAPPPFMYM